MKLLNINLGENFLHEAQKIIAANERDVSKTTIICTSLQVGAMLAQYFRASKGEAMPLITSIGAIDEICLAKLHANNNLNINFENVFTTKKILHDFDRYLLMYNFLDCNEAKTKAVIEIIDSLTNSPHFAEQLFACGNNFYEAFNCFINATLSNIDESFSLKLLKDLETVLKATKHLGQYLQENNLQTKIQKRLEIASKLVQFLQTSSMPIYFIGQNGENNLFNFIAKSAIGKDNINKSNIKFICYGFEAPFANIFSNIFVNQFSKNIAKLQVLATKQPSNSINFITTANFNEQLQLVLNTAKQCPQQKILLLTSNYDEAKRVEIFLQTNNLPCYNSFGSKIMEGVVYNLFCTMLRLGRRFNKIDLLNFVSSPLLASNLVFAEQEKQELENIFRSDISFASIKQMHGLTGHLAKLDVSSILLEKLLEKTEVIVAFINQITLLKTDGIIKAFEALIDVFQRATTKTVKQTEEYREFITFIKTDLADINPALFNNAAPTIENILNICNIFAKSRSFRVGKMEDFNINILSQKEARYLHFDTTIALNFNEQNFGDVNVRGILTDKIKLLFGLEGKSDSFYKQLASFKDIAFAKTQTLTLYSTQESIVDGVFAPSHFLHFMPHKAFAYNGSYTNIANNCQKQLQFNLCHKPLSFSHTSLNLISQSSFNFAIRYILKLYELKPIYKTPNGANIGSLLHKCFAELVKQIKEGRINNVTDSIACVKQVFERAYNAMFEKQSSAQNQAFTLHLWLYLLQFTTKYLYLNDLKNIAQTAEQISGTHFFVEQEQDENKDDKIQTQITTQIEGEQITCTLSARPDRKDYFANKTRIIDYKTTIPAQKYRGFQMEIIDFILSNTRSPNMPARDMEGQPTNNLHQVREYYFYSLSPVQYIIKTEQHNLNPNLPQLFASFTSQFFNNTFVFE